ncbi:MAG: hypothetical protein WCL10_11720 [Novosphingobium sp.]|uniref:hypothetical protein n=1 Tax=Novosphingobium sp. TaxID=1874826 RepID=UPI00301B4F1E
MYELLFRSRWYALVWAVLMAVSAVMFTTTGAGAWLTGTKPDARASEEAREHQFRSWAEDDKRRLGEDQGYDPSSPEVVRDGLPRREDGNDPKYRTVPFTPDQADEDADPATDQ